MNERTTVFKTSCKDCIFAKWGETPEGKLEQIGCSFNDRLSIYKDTNKTEKKIDEEKEYYEIKTFCNACRNEEWVERYNVEDPYQKVTEEVSNQFDAVILFYSPVPSFGRNRKFAQEEIENAVVSVVEQSLKPNKVIVAVYDEGLNYQKIISGVDKHFKKHNIKYELTRVLYDNLKERDVIDQAVRRCDGSYYSVFKVNKDVPKDFFEKINNILNKDLIFFSCIVPKEDELHGLTIQRRVHKLVGGNKASAYGEETTVYFKVEEKIKKLAEEQGVKHMVREL